VVHERNTHLDKLRLVAVYRDNFVLFRIPDKNLCFAYLEDEAYVRFRRSLLFFEVEGDGFRLIKPLQVSLLFGTRRIESVLFADNAVRFLRPLRFFSQPS
jgi:hypothetical protein